MQRHWQAPRRSFFDSIASAIEAIKCPAVWQGQLCKHAVCIPHTIPHFVGLPM